MDDLTRTFYRWAFRDKWREARGTEFQDFFSDIMEKGHPGDFQRVRPWGNVGDRKNDGYLRSERRMFAVYAPRDATAAEQIAKINSDFEGALPHWEQYFDSWVFVHNDPDGLGPDVSKALLILDGGHDNLDVFSWGREDLWQEVAPLAEDDLRELFGAVPSREDVAALGMEELDPVLNHLARLPDPGLADLRPVPAGKIEWNQLSAASAQLLNVGFLRTPLVGDYFRRVAEPLLRDQIAAGFRSRYDALSGEGLPPDEILSHLLNYAGGLRGEPSRMIAVLTVVAYFFQECEIFRRPEVSA